MIVNKVRYRTQSRGMNDRESQIGPEGERTNTDVGKAAPATKLYTWQIFARVFVCAQAVATATVCHRVGARKRQEDRQTGGESERARKSDGLVCDTNGTHQTAPSVGTINTIQQHTAPYRNFNREENEEAEEKNINKCCYLLCESQQLTIY